MKTSQEETILWIPVEHGLPDNCRNVLVTTQEGQVFGDFYYLNGRWRIDDGAGRIQLPHRIIAWAEYPKGYRP